jgi:hypothetical protein
MSSVNRIEQFFIELDGLWGGADPRLAIKMLGSTALMLQTEYLRNTKDTDVLGIMPVEGEVREKLTNLAGHGSPMEADYRFYLDIVPSGLPFLPHTPQFLPLDSLNARLGSFQVSALAVIDVVVSKLKRFNGRDRDDIRAMVDMELVEREELLERFRSAVDRFSGDARAEDLPKVVRNLHWIERECFSAPPTRIELPPWVDPD